MVKNLLAMQETRVQSLSWGDPLEEGMATHSSILAWRIQWTEEPGRLQSIGSQRVGHNWATNTFTFQDRGPHELHSMEMDRGLWARMRMVIWMKQVIEAEEHHRDQVGSLAVKFRWSSGSLLFSREGAQIFLVLEWWNLHLDFFKQNVSYV